MEQTSQEPVESYPAEIKTLRRRSKALLQSAIKRQVIADQLQYALSSGDTSLLTHGPKATRRRIQYQAYLSVKDQKESEALAGQIADMESRVKSGPSITPERIVESKEADGRPSWLYSCPSCNEPRKASALGRSTCGACGIRLWLS